MKTNIQCWGFRVNSQSNDISNYLYKEIKSGRLRQGWGYEDGQKLPELKVDKGAKRNLAIYNNVKEGDYLLIPHLPSNDMVTMVRAIQDFNCGYQFDRNNAWSDYGHIFPVRKLCSFNRSNPNIAGCIRSSLRNRLRFWKMNVSVEDIEHIANINEADLKEGTDIETQVDMLLGDAISEAVNIQTLSQSLDDNFYKAFDASEWEFVLKMIFSELYADCNVTRIGGRGEKDHGCDLLITFPSLCKEKEYAIGIQVKDYSDIVGPNVIYQVLKAENLNNEKRQLIDKFLIIINAPAGRNDALKAECKANNVQLLFREDVHNLLVKTAIKRLGIK